MAQAQQNGARPKLKIKKGDRVVVIAGRDKGKTGEVLRVVPKDLRVVVQGVNMVKKHRRPSAMGAGGIEDMEAPIHISNVAHIDPGSNKPTRIGYRTEGERKVRFAKRSGELIDR
jgi:large subunit ribosomal protein L24